MTGKAVNFVAAGLIAAGLGVSSFSASRLPERPVDAELTVHEWGTFTSMAGPDGRAMRWLALTGSTNLPEFVEHFRDADFKCGLTGTIRMETPVIYFYTTRETSVSVKVSFSNGFITEWYPHASGVEPAAVRPESHADGSIRWDNVRLLPGSQPVLPAGDKGAHYYAARDTAATPLRVKGGGADQGADQNEKFLFYRGVGSAPLPVGATVGPDGKVLVRNLGTDAIPTVMLIESRGERVGYRIASGVRGEAVMESPPLNASRESLLADLKKTLVAQGLYDDEARAMLATWRNSWFEEGSRLLYILPAPAVNAMLPLSVNPAPARTVRVFVGRMELVTPSTESAVERAFAQHDQKTLDQYRRFLEPILKSMMARNRSDAGRAHSLDASLNSVYSYACRPAWQDTR